MNYNKSGLIVLIASVFFSFAWIAWLVFFSTPVDLAELEGESTSSVKKEAADKGVDISEVKEPWLSSELLIRHGSQIYQTYCASCHGKTGLGDGLAAAALNPPPRNLVTGGWKQGGSSIAFYKTLVEGIEGSSMVSFSYLSSQDRWALVHYIRSITEDKEEDDPEELKEFAKTAK